MDGGGLLATGDHLRLTSRSYLPASLSHQPPPFFHRALAGGLQPSGVGLLCQAAASTCPQFLWTTRELASTTPEFTTFSSDSRSSPSYLARFSREVIHFP